MLLKKKQSKKKRHNPCTTLHNVRFAFRRKRTRLHKAFSRRKSLCSTLCAQGVRLSTRCVLFSVTVALAQGYAQGLHKVVETPPHTRQPCSHNVFFSVTHNIHIYIYICMHTYACIRMHAYICMHTHACI